MTNDDGGMSACVGGQIDSTKKWKYKKLVHDQKIMHLSKRKFSTETKRKMRWVINMYDDCQNIRVLVVSLWLKL